MSHNRPGHRSAPSEAPLLAMSYNEKGKYSLFSAATVHAPIRGRRFILTLCLALSAISLFCLAVSSLWTTDSKFQSTLDDPVPVSEHTDDLSGLCSSYLNAHPSNAHPIIPPPPPPPDPYDYKNVVLGPPTQSLWDNLRKDTKYITSWMAAGWTNDVMTIGNLIYLAIITERVPIVPMFTPSHIGGDAPPIAFGEVFDVPRLSKAIGKPILEWYQVKDANSTYLDELGCWSVWQSVQYGEDFPRNSAVPHWIQTDISYTKTPDWIKLIPGYEHDQHTTFWALAALSFPQIREQSLVPPQPSLQLGRVIPPSDHLLCYDYMYYVCAHKSFEYEADYSPAWRFVMQYMRFTDELIEITDGYIRRALKISASIPTPYWITIHVRHHDFANWCGTVPIQDCFATHPVYARRVHEVQEELLETKGIDAKYVFMTSDENDPAWWDEVAAMGWYRLDHAAERTEQKYSRWHPVLIDAVLQSTGAGFVGTDRSTMSTIARRRAEAWNDAATRTVRWGNPNADDH